MLIYTLMARSHWAECHSVCFPNRNLSVRGANGSYSGSIRCVPGTAFGSYNDVLCIFKIIFIDLPNHPNVASMCILEVLREHCRSIRRVRKTFGKHVSSSGCIRSETLEVLCSVCFPNLEHDEYFPNAFRTRRINLESTKLFPHVFRTLSEPFRVTLTSGRML